MDCLRILVTHNRAFKNIIILITIGTVFTFLSSFHPTTTKHDDFRISTAALVTQWYNLYLKLESSDLNAYPPISAERLAKMGFAGHLIHQQSKLTNIQDKNVFLLSLNEVYSNLLLDFFSDIYTSKELIAELKGRFEVQYGKSTNIGQVENTAENIIYTVQCADVFHSLSQSSHLSLTQNTQFEAYGFCQHNPTLPDWGRKATIHIDQNITFLPEPFSSHVSLDQAILHDALLVYAQSINMSREDKWIAEFWSDDVRGLTFSPAGRWIAIANQLVQNEDLATRDLFNLYLKLGIGLNDSAILCWKYKYFYQLQRPSQYIRKHIASNWQPFHEDPNFPSYPSGHAVLGACAATILESTFGEKYAFTDRSHQDRLEFFSQNRKFKSIKEAASENAYSRFLLGVHFKEDCEAGLRLGFEVGESVNKATNFELYKAIPEPNLN